MVPSKTKVLNFSFDSIVKTYRRILNKLKYNLIIV